MSCDLQGFTYKRWDFKDDLKLFKNNNLKVWFWFLAFNSILKDLKKKEPSLQWQGTLIVRKKTE